MVLGLVPEVRIFGQADNINTEFMRAFTRGIENSQILRDDTKFNVNTHIISNIGVGASYAVLDNESMRLSIGSTRKNI